MKSRIIFISILVNLFVLFSCDDQVYPTLDYSNPLVSIDAFVNDKNETQIVRVMKTVPYFDNVNIEVVDDAQVYIMDDEGTKFDFVLIKDGEYGWTPTDENGFGVIGHEYTMHVIIGEDSYESTSLKNRVPTLDSITFRFEKASLGMDDSYFGEFWARDFEGEDDTYWIKAFKNDTLLGKSSELNIAYDAGFSAGGLIDGIIFISPIRDGVNSFEEDDKTGNIVSPYDDGDSLYVEIHSISQEAFTFFRQVAEQTNRPGGFAELFASPMSNVTTNITCTSNPDIEVVGFFCVSSVSANGKRLDISKVPKE